MFELKECKERAYVRFHERFSEPLCDIGFRREKTGYYLADVENGFIANVHMQPSCTGDICDVYIGMRTTADNHMFLREKLFGEDDPEALWNVDYHSLLYVYYGLGRALEERGQMEKQVDNMYNGFIENVYPIFKTIHDERSCYKAMILTDRIFPTKIARHYVYTAISCGYVKRAMRRIRGIRQRKFEPLAGYKSEYMRTLELLESGKMDEVERIIQSNREESKRRYYAYIKKWGY